MAGMIRLLLAGADVDGTLVTEDKVLTAPAAVPCGSCAAAGIAFAITSGRPPARHEHADRAARFADADRRLQWRRICHPDLSVIESHTLDPAAAKKTLS